MLLSIIVPTLGSPTLARALASCLAQELPADVEVEVLIIDRSTDGLSGLQAPRDAAMPVRIVQAPVASLSEARHAGVRAAQGRYVAFLDDDHEACTCVATPPSACTETAVELYARTLAADDGAGISAMLPSLHLGNALFDKAACFPAAASPLDDASFLLMLARRRIPLTWAAYAWSRLDIAPERMTLPSLAADLFRNGQTITRLHFHAPGLGRLRGLASMGSGLAEAGLFRVAALALARFQPAQAMSLMLRAHAGAGRLLWMRPCPLRRASTRTATEAAPLPAPPALTPLALSPPALTAPPPASAVPPGDAPLVSIIIVSHRTRELTLECLRSLTRETTAVSYEILVVDNASDDGSAAAIAGAFPGVRLTALPGNIGFARASNLAAEQARGEFLLLLEPDTVVLDAAIDRLVAFAHERPRAGIWGGRTLYANHTLNPTSCWRHMTLWNLFCRAAGLDGLLPNSRLFNSEAYGRWDRMTVGKVDIVTGCFFLIERRRWQQLDGFDPAFSMYGAEADLCLRAARLGARPIVTPQATIIHYGGASQRPEPEWVLGLLTARSELIRRHWCAPSRWLGLALLSLLPLARAIVLGLADRFTERPDLDGGRAGPWWRIWLARERWRRGFGAPEPG